MHAVKSNSGLVNLVSSFGHVNTRPRAALISLVRNSELEGIVQSMQQLEYHWNRNYHYPWIFFNDEEFNDEFKVCGRSMSGLETNARADRDTKSYLSQLLL